MVRCNLGGGFKILKKDLDSGLVKVRTYKTYLEYWVYRYKSPEGNLYLPDGSKHLLHDQAMTYLFCIIMTKDNDDHRKITSDGFLIKGVRIDGEDIKTYLAKTGRGL